MYNSDHVSLDELQAQEHGLHGDSDSVPYGNAPVDMYMENNRYARMDHTSEEAEMRRKRKNKMLRSRPFESYYPYD